MPKAKKSEGKAKKVKRVVKAKVEKTEKKEEKKEGKAVGKIAHYFDQINVAVVEISGKLKVGDKIRIKGTTTDFEQKVDSMQIEHEQVKEAKKGDAVGMKVADRVRPNDLVYMAE